MVSLPIVKTAALEQPRTSPGLAALLAWIALNAADALVTWYSLAWARLRGTRSSPPPSNSWAQGLCCC